MLSLAAVFSILLQVGSPSPPQVPDSLMVAATRDPVMFVMVAAHLGLPSGLEVRASDQRPSGRPEFQSASQRTVPLSEVLTAFNAAHSDYHAQLSGAVIVIRPVQRKAAYLDQTSALGQIDVVGVTAAARKIFVAIDPSLDAAGATIGSRIGLDAAAAGDSVRIKLNGQGRTNIQLLNDVVSQSPRGWMVVTDGEAESPQIVRVGFVNRGGASTFLELKRTKQ